MSTLHAEWLLLRLDAVRRNLPVAFRNATVEHPDVRDWCQRLLEGETDALLLLGSVGTGKTWTAWGCWPHLIGRGWAGSWRAVTEQGFLDALLPGGDRSVAVMAEEADVLLLDDVGAGVVSDWSRSRVFGLLDARWAARRPTVVTSNLSQGRLAAHLGERATSRLGQRLTVVTLTGPDRRAS